MESTVCPTCLYDWGARLETHTRQAECASNLEIRAVCVVHPSFKIIPSLGFEELLYNAGIEEWTLSTKPGVPHAPIWAVRICKALWLQGHRLWILREVAARPPVQKRLVSQPYIDDILYWLLMEKTK